MSQPSTDKEWPQFRDNVSYSNKSSLNTLEWCIPRPTSNRDRKNVWVVYIHGGAWRDPEINASSFNSTRDQLLNSSEAEHVAGYASINYRLSPYPSHSRHPSSPTDPARNAHHPDHIRDVLTALLHLQETFQFEDRYLVVGHSCGATLAFQVAMDQSWTIEIESNQHLSAKIIPPMAILAVEGLYDLPALVKFHHDQPAYRDLVVNAFGEDESVWKEVSPSHASWKKTWPNGRLVVLAHSHDDELVEWNQVQLQYDALAADGWSSDGPRRLRLMRVYGKHDEIWKNARELARAVQVALQDLVSTHAAGS